MNDLSNCFSSIVKKRNRLLFNNGKFTLKGGKNDNKYKTTVLAKSNYNLVVFNVGDNSHASFVKNGYNKNCDYIFINIEDKNINFILCELKKSTNKIDNGLKQLKYSIPLAHYLKQLLITHCSTIQESLQINYKKIILIKDTKDKQPIKNEPEKENGALIFFGNEFSFKEFV